MDLLGKGNQAFVAKAVEPVELLGIDGLAEEDGDEADEDDHADGRLQEGDGLAQRQVLIPVVATDDLVPLDADVGFQGGGILVAAEEVGSVLHQGDVAMDDDLSFLVHIGIDLIGNEILVLLELLKKDEGMGGDLVVVPFQVFVLRVLLAHRVGLDDVERRAVDIKLPACMAIGDGGGKKGQHQEGRKAQDDVEQDVEDLPPLPLPMEEGREGGILLLPALLVLGVEDGDVLFDDVVVMLFQKEALSGTIEEDKGSEKKDNDQKHANQNNDPCNLFHGNLFLRDNLYLRPYSTPPPTTLSMKTVLFTESSQLATKIFQTSSH